LLLLLLLCGIICRIVVVASSWRHFSLSRTVGATGSISVAPPFGCRRRLLHFNWQAAVLLPCLPIALAID